MTFLRPRQVQAINDIRVAYRSGYRAPILCAATGFGKTHTSAAIIQSALDKGKTVWFLAHLREILNDTSSRLKQAGISFGEIAAGKPLEYHKRVQLVSVQTAVRRTDLPQPDLVIVDECHLAAAKTYKVVLGRAGNPALLGLTGTPCRLDGKGLDEMFDTIVPTCSTDDLIDEGLLAPIVYFAPERPDLSKVKTFAGDYKVNELAHVMDNPDLTGRAVEQYMLHCDGAKAVVFCTGIDHAENVAETFRLAGYKAVAISGETKPPEREAALTGLRNGDLQVVCNAKLWSAGVDIPQLECIILLRPTKSLTFYLQAIGRGLRTSPGKNNLVVLDHSGSIFQFGPPGMARKWSLRGRDKREQAGPVKQCPACFCCHKPAPQCPECGFIYPVDDKKDLNQSDDDLVELTSDEMLAMERRINAKKSKEESLRRQKEVGQARTLDALVLLGISRGYRFPVQWARKILNSRAIKRK